MDELLNQNDINMLINKLQHFTICNNIIKCNCGDEKTVIHVIYAFNGEIYTDERLCHFCYYSVKDFIEGYCVIVDEKGKHHRAAMVNLN